MRKIFILCSALFLLTLTGCDADNTAGPGEDGNYNTVPPIDTASLTLDSSNYSLNAGNYTIYTLQDTFNGCPFFMIEITGSNIALAVEFMHSNTSYPGAFEFENLNTFEYYEGWSSEYNTLVGMVPPENLVISDVTYSDTNIIFNLSGRVLRGADSNYIAISGSFNLSLPGPGVADQYEDDDSYASATGVSNGVTNSHSFHDSGDLDYISFNGISNNTYAIIAEVDGGTADTILRLYDTDGTTQLGYNDDYSGTNNLTIDSYSSAIEWVCPADGTYYLRIENFFDNGSAEHTYTLVVLENY
ncbi:MAG TPA: hypothetical protein VKS21_13525 [Spirochaetota bacterium]|nr:hypothetical protein [Spirochaetota bacterium]